MDKKIKIIQEAASLIGADEEDISEEEAQKMLRSLVMSNDNIRIRKARSTLNRTREGRNE